jgi:hypothetical protein
MPGITPPDSTGTGASYTVELNGVQIGTLAVSGGAASVSIAGTMPDFMQVVKIWLEPGGHILYDNGPRPAVALTPGTYQVKATLRAKPRPDIYGSSADLTLTCNGTSTATITLRVPNPEEWGLRADIYTFTLRRPRGLPSRGQLHLQRHLVRGGYILLAVRYWGKTGLVCRRRISLGLFAGFCA